MWESLVSKSIALRAGIVSRLEIEGVGEMEQAKSWLGASETMATTLSSAPR